MRSGDGGGRVGGRRGTKKILGVEVKTKQKQTEKSLEKRQRVGHSSPCPSSRRCGGPLLVDRRHPGVEHGEVAASSTSCGTRSASVEPFFVNDAPLYGALASRQRARPLGRSRRRGQRVDQLRDHDEIAAEDEDSACFWSFFSRFLRKK
jgi:hypothetical protein